MKSIISDLLLIAGVSAIAVGLWYIDFRLSLIIMGTILLAGAIIIGRGKVPEKEVKKRQVSYVD